VKSNYSTPPALSQTKSFGHLKSLKVRWNGPSTRWKLPEFFASDRDEHLDEIAKPVDDALDRCDAVLFLVDPTDEVNLARNIGTLQRMLSYNKRKGSNPKPIALVFAQADKYLPTFQDYYKWTKTPWSEEAEKQYKLALNAARDRLIRYLESSDSLQQLHHYWGTHGSRDLSLHQMFPISCVAESNGKLHFKPIWIHEPILWAIGRVQALRMQAGNRRGRRLRYFAAAIFACFLFAIGCFWVYGSAQANQELGKVAEFCRNHPDHESDEARRQQFENLFSNPWVKVPFLTPRALDEQRQLAAQERDNRLTYRFDKLKRQAEELFGEGKYQQCLDVLKSSSLMDEPDWSLELNELLKQKRTERNEAELARLNEQKTGVLSKEDDELTEADFDAPLGAVRNSFLKDETGFVEKNAAIGAELKERKQLLQFNRLQSKLAKLSGDNKAIDRIQEIKNTETIVWTESRKEKIASQYADAMRQWEDFDVIDQLLPELRKHPKLGDAQKRIDLIKLADRWRKGRYKSTIDDQMEVALFDRIRFAEDSKSDSVRSFCAEFLTEMPTSKFLREVQRIDDSVAWTAAKTTYEDQLVSYADRLKVLRAYVSIPYAKSKVQANLSISRIQGQWDRSDFGTLSGLAVKGRLQSWVAFHKAIKAAEDYLAVTDEPRKMQVEVQQFLTQLKAFDMKGDPNKGGVEGLELRVVGVSLTDTNDLNDSELPSVRVFLLRKLPKYNTIDDLLPKEKHKQPPWFLLPTSNRDHSNLSTLNFKPGYMFFSGNDRFFELTFDITNTSKYIGWRIGPVPWMIDFGDSFFTAAEGTTTIIYPNFQWKDSAGEITREVGASVVIQWKGSKLHELYLPKWSEAVQPFQDQLPPFPKDIGQKVREVGGDVAEAVLRYSQKVGLFPISLQDSPGVACCGSGE